MDWTASRDYAGIPLCWHAYFRILVSRIADRDRAQQSRCRDGGKFKHTSLIQKKRTNNVARYWPLAAQSFTKVCERIYRCQVGPHTNLTTGNELRRTTPCLSWTLKQRWYTSEHLIEQSLLSYAVSTIWSNSLNVRNSNTKLWLIHTHIYPGIQATCSKIS